MIWVPVLFLMCAQMLMHATAHRDCTVYRHRTRESALEADPERKVPAALGTQTHISIALVRCSTNRTIPATHT